MNNSEPTTISVRLGNESKVIAGKECIQGISFLHERLYHNPNPTTVNIFNAFRDANEENCEAQKFEFDTRMESKLLSNHPLAKKLGVKSGGVGVLGHMESFTVPAKRAKDLVALLTTNKDQLLEYER